MSRASCILFVGRTGNCAGGGQPSGDGRGNIFPAATATCRAPPISALDRPPRLPLYYGLARGRLAALGPRLGGRLQLAVVAFRRADRAPTAKARQGDDGKASGHSPLRRCFDATMLPKDQGSPRKDNVKAMVVFRPTGGQIPSPAMPEAARGMEQLELLVVGDPHPTHLGGALRAARDNTYMLPILHPVRDYVPGLLAPVSNPLAAMGAKQIVKPIFQSKDRLPRRCICWPGKLGFRPT